MSGMPDFIQKGPILRKMDNHYTQRNRLQAFLDGLITLPPYPVGNVADQGVINGAYTQQEADHLKQHLLTSQNREEILRNALIWALRLSITNHPRLPIVFYWVCHPGHDEVTFETTHHLYQDLELKQESVARLETSFWQRRDPESRFEEMLKEIQEIIAQVVEREGDYFEVAVCKSDHQVTVIVHTPERGPAPPPHRVTHKENIWVFKEPNFTRVPKQVLSAR